MKITALITTAIIALSIFAAAPATAKTTDSMDERIAAVLDERLGGARTGWNEVTWDGGDVVLTLSAFTDAAAKAVGG